MLHATSLLIRQTNPDWLFFWILPDIFPDPQVFIMAMYNMFIIICLPGKIGIYFACLFCYGGFI